MSDQERPQRPIICTMMLSHSNGRDEKNCDECSNAPIAYQCLEKGCEVKICKECEKKHNPVHTMLY